MVNIMDVATYLISHTVHRGFDSHSGIWSIVTIVRNGGINMSKRELQVKINREVLSNWTQTKEVWDKVPKEVTVTRIDYCQCGYIVWGQYIFLVSYSTMVAYIDPDGVLVDVLRLVYGYTVTSAKHISKFRNRFNHWREITYREV